MRYGIRSITMDDIARELSISKKTIYQYFKDKDDIVNQVTQTYLEEDQKEYQAILDSGENAVDQMFKLSKCYRKTMSEINPSLLFDLKKYHHDAWAMWLSYKKEFIKSTLVENLNKGIEEGYYRQEIKPEILATFRVEQVQLIFDEKVFPRDKYDFTEVQLHLFDHFIHGILTSKGKELFENYKLEKPYAKAF